MSAFARVQTQIKDLNILKQSLSDLNMKFESNAKDVRFYGKGPQDLEVYVSSHRIGFVKNANDNSLDLVGDSDYKKQFDKIRQKYSENVTRKIIQQRGYLVAEVKAETNGNIVLVAKRQSYA